MVQVQKSFNTRREATGHPAGCQEVGRCSSRGESWGMCITFASANVNTAEPTLALKPRGDVTRNPKQGYQWPQNRTCVRQKLFLSRSVQSSARYKGVHL